MKAIVIGATGATGKFLIEELIKNNDYTEVVVLVRRKYFESHPKLKEIVIDFNHLANHKNDIVGDVAFSVLGTTLKDAGSKEAQWKIDYEYNYQFAQFCAENKIPSFVLLSAMGANPTSSIFYNKIKGKLEEVIKKLNFEQLIIFQPAGLIRPNSDRFGENMMVKIVGFFNQFGILKSYQLIHVRDLAKAMIDAKKQYPTGTNIISLKMIINLIDNNI